MVAVFRKMSEWKRKESSKMEVIDSYNLISETKSHYFSYLDQIIRTSPQQCGGTDSLVIIL